MLRTFFDSLGRMKYSDATYSSLGFILALSVLNESLPLKWLKNCFSRRFFENDLI